SHRFQILSAFALSLIFILTNIHQPAYAQSKYDVSLRTFGQTYEGNLCITVGGASCILEMMRLHQMLKHPSRWTFKAR
ncbi:hypothetical protein KFU94_36155, partial [Chloroflexi bacterium TSY]|nr:hypothetical protein [Chloroflexi bacterium TSY]